MSRRAVYAICLERLCATDGWAQLPKDYQDRIAGRMRERAAAELIAEPWREAASVLTIMREQITAAPAVLEAALAEVRRILRPQAVEIAVRTLISGAIESPGLTQPPPSPSRRNWRSLTGRRRKRNAGSARPGGGATVRRVDRPQARKRLLLAAAA